MTKSKKYIYRNNGKQIAMRNGESNNKFKEKLEK